MEVKTTKTFYEEKGYHDCRATQILTAMYHFHAPTFLATPNQFKLFYEKEERNSIYTFPTFGNDGYHQPTPFFNTLRIGTMNDEFLKALIICLRAKPALRRKGKLEEAQNSELGLSNSRSLDESPKGFKPINKLQKGNEKYPSFKYTNSKGETETVEIRIYSHHAAQDFDDC